MFIDLDTPGATLPGTAEIPTDEMERIVARHTIYLDELKHLQNDEDRAAADDKERW